MSAFGGKADIANMPRRPLKTQSGPLLSWSFLDAHSLDFSLCYTGGRMQGAGH